MRVIAQLMSAKINNVFKYIISKNCSNVSTYFGIFLNEYHNNSQLFTICYWSVTYGYYVSKMKKDLYD